jgi:hypothetical protein
LLSRKAGMTAADESRRRENRGPEKAAPQIVAKRSAIVTAKKPARKG